MNRLFHCQLARYLLIFAVINCVRAYNVVDEYEVNNGLHNIEGKVLAPELYSSSDINWQRDTVISINDGEYTGYLKDDGSFVVSNVPSGSYVVEILNPDYYYESVTSLKSIICFLRNQRNNENYFVVAGSCRDQSERKIPST